MIEFKNVTKKYQNGTVALDNVNLKINDGEFVFIVGESGAGKSTLTKLLLREETVTSGQITVTAKTNEKTEYFDLGNLSASKIPYYRRKLGVVFQDFRLFPDKTVYENIAFVLRVVGKSPRTVKRNVQTLLKRVNLADKASCYPDELSGGEQQRVALARALANDSSIIIADEPTGNIDPVMSYDIMNLLIYIQQKFGKTVIVVTHEKELVDYFKQRVVTIKRGKIVDDRVGTMFETSEQEEASGKII